MSFQQLLLLGKAPSALLHIQPRMCLRHVCNNLVLVALARLKRWRLIIIAVVGTFGDAPLTLHHLIFFRTFFLLLHVAIMVFIAVEKISVVAVVVVVVAVDVAVVVVAAAASNKDDTNNNVNGKLAW